MKVKLVACLILPALFTVVAACGSDDGGNKVASVNSGAPSSSKEQPKGANLDPADEDKIREFAKCMRENGIDMPDPQGGGIALAAPADGDVAKMEKAHEACKKFLPNGGEYKEPSQEEKDKMREQAKCMREHGVDMPDPDFSGTGGRGTIDFGDDTKKFEEALKACGMGEGGMAVAPAVPGNG